MRANCCLAEEAAEAALEASYSEQGEEVYVAVVAEVHQDRQCAAPDSAEVTLDQEVRPLEVRLCWCSWRRCLSEDQRRTFEEGC